MTPPTLTRAAKACVDNFLKYGIQLDSRTSGPINRTAKRPGQSAENTNQSAPYPARLSVIGRSLSRESEEATVNNYPPERRPIGWWLKTADARIEQAFEDVFESRSITRREWQVLEPVSRSPVSEPELLQRLEAFAGAQSAVDELRQRGLLANHEGVLTLTDAGSAAHANAATCVATVRGAVSAALPGENYATLVRLLADLVDGLDRTSKSSH